MNWLERLTPARPGALMEPAVVADGYIESYVSWREACEHVRSAYERWDKRNMPNRALAFDEYRAALAREEHAAHIHSDWVERVRALER